MTYANSYQPFFPTMSKPTNQPKMLNIPELQKVVQDHELIDRLDCVKHMWNAIGLKEEHTVHSKANKFIVAVATHYEVLEAKTHLSLIDFRCPIDALNFLEEFYTSNTKYFGCFRLHYLVPLNGPDGVTNLIIETSLSELIKFATKEKDETV